MSPLREVLITLKTLTQAELELVQLWVETLSDGSAMKPLGVEQAKPKHDPTYYRPDGAVKEPVTVKTKKRVVHQRRSKEPTRKTRTPKAGTAIAKVWDAVKQSSGQLAAKDLAEILEMKPALVITAMGRLHQGHKSVLKREWQPGRTSSEGMRLRGGQYLYTYTGKRTGGDGVSE